MRSQRMPGSKAMTIKAKNRLEYRAQLQRHRDREILKVVRELVAKEVSQ